MPLDSYPFSERYTWVADRYGVTWQLSRGEVDQGTITPCLMFVDEEVDNAAPAMERYPSLFPESSIDAVERYGPDEAPDIEGTV